MPYIGKEPKTITTISDLTATGTTALTGNATAAGTLDVTGAITSSAGATITTADNTAQLTLTSTDADANAGPVLDLVRDSGSPADSDNTGTIVFKADDDGGNSTEFAKIETSIIDASNTTEDGRLLIRTMTAGTATSRLDFTNTETVFNDSSIDVDFRVESDSRTHMLFVDSSADAVGIGTSSPNVTLHVFGSSAEVAIDDTGAEPKVRFRDNGSTRALLKVDSSNNMEFHTGPDGSTAEKMTLLSSGNFLLGKTAENIGTAGVELGASGYVQATRDGTTLYLNRLSDGQLAFFGRSGTERGSIDVSTSGTTYNTTSDIRLKQDIEPLEATDKLMAMNPVSYAWKEDPNGPRSMGFIAQEMKEIVPDAVSVDDSEEKMMSMDYGRITPILVSALQDAHRKIEELETRLAALES